MSSMSVYELTQNAAYLQQLLEDGDIDQQTYDDTMESLMIDNKVENVCKVIKNLEAQAAAIKQEEQRLAEKRATAENGVKRLKKSLVELMQASMDKKIKTTLFTVSLGASSSVEVYQQDKLPDNFLKPQPPTVDKTAIGKALKEGQKVPGARIKTSNYVTIR